MRSMFVLCLLILLVGPALALNVFSDGSDRDLTLTGTGNYPIDLGAAVTGDWYTTNGNGAGVYDPSKWAVVFKYTSNQRAIKRARDDIKAHLLALKLFKENTRVIFRAQGRILWVFSYLYNNFGRRRDES